MSHEPVVQLVDAAGLRQSLAEICGSQEEFQRFFAGVFDELDGLASELVRRQRAWSTERDEAEESLRQRAARLEEERHALAAEREQLVRQAGPSADRAGEPSTEHRDRIERMLQEAERQREAFQAAIEAAQARDGRLSELLDELSQARADLSEARDQIQRLRKELESSGPGAVSATPDEGLQSRLAQLEQERAQLDQERVVIETELESVRNRAAEMAENLAEQRREMSSEREQWAQELKRMRRLLENISAHRMAPLPVETPPAPSEPHESAASSSGGAGDPVLDSVMAQFEMLQKDIVRRRRAGAEVVH